MQPIPGIDAYVPKSNVLIGDAIMAGQRIALQRRAQQADENRQKVQAENERIRQAEAVKDFELRKQQVEEGAKYRTDVLRQQEAMRKQQQDALIQKRAFEQADFEAKQKDQMAEALAMQEALTGEPNTQVDHNLRDTPGWATGAAKGAAARAELAQREKIAQMRSKKKEPKEPVTPGITIVGGIPIRVDSQGKEHSLTESELSAWEKSKRDEKKVDPPSVIGRVLIKDGKPTFQKTK